MQNYDSCMPAERDILQNPIPRTTLPVFSTVARGTECVVLPQTVVVVSDKYKSMAEVYIVP